MSFSRYNGAMATTHGWLCSFFIPSIRAIFLKRLKQKCEILERELKAEEFVLGEMALLGRVRGLDECNATLNRLLKEVGEFTKEDRAYIVDENNGFYNNKFEWCRSGVTSEKDDLQGLTLADMPYWIPKLSEGESILIENIEDVKEIMPVEYEILRSCTNNQKCGIIWL